MAYLNVTATLTTSETSAIGLEFQKQIRDRDQFSSLDYLYIPEDPETTKLGVGRVLKPYGLRHTASFLGAEATKRYIEALESNYIGREGFAHVVAGSGFTYVHNLAVSDKAPLLRTGGIFVVEEGF